MQTKPVWVYNVLGKDSTLWKEIQILHGKMAFGFFSLPPQVLVAIVIFCRDSVRINLGHESKPYAEE